MHNVLLASQGVFSSTEVQKYMTYSKTKLVRKAYLLRQEGKFSQGGS